MQKSQVFFDACREQELTGQQGVVIPMANVKQLMLRDDIIEAVKAGSFHIYGVHTLSEALTLMTGLPIDTMNKKGRYRKDTLFGKVLSRLMLWDENQNEEEDIDDKKSKKKDKKKRKAKRQKKEDHRRKDTAKHQRNESEVVDTMNGRKEVIDDEKSIDNDENAKPLDSI